MPLRADPAQDVGRDDEHVLDRQGQGIGCYAGQFSKYEGLTVNAAEAINSAGGEIIGANGKPNLNTAEAKAGLGNLVKAYADGTSRRKPSPSRKSRVGRRSRTASCSSCATGPTCTTWPRRTAAPR